MYLWLMNYIVLMPTGTLACFVNYQINKQQLYFQIHLYEGESKHKSRLGTTEKRVGGQEGHFENGCDYY